MAGKDLSAERLHPFNIVGIDHADIAASFQTGLIGEAGKIVDNTAVLFESPVNRDVLKAAYVTEASCKKCLLFSASFPRLLSSFETVLPDSCIPGMNIDIQLRS